MLLFLDRVYLQYRESFKSPRLKKLTDLKHVLHFHLAFLHKKLQFHYLIPLKCKNCSTKV